MSLTNAYLVTTKNLEAFLNAVQSAKAPERFNNKFLTQLDFTSSNDRLFIGLFKALGMIDESGVPTKRYYAYLDQGESRKVLAEAIREAYEDLFAVNKKANDLSVDEIKNKLKTLTQGQKSENVVGLMAATFKALCALADWKHPLPEKEDKKGASLKVSRQISARKSTILPGRTKRTPGRSRSTMTSTFTSRSLATQRYSTPSLKR